MTPTKERVGSWGWAALAYRYEGRGERGWYWPVTCRVAQRAAMGICSGTRVLELRCLMARF